MIVASVILWHLFFLVSKSIVHSFNTVDHESQLHTTPQLCFACGVCVCACVQHFPVPLYGRQLCNMTSADRTTRLRVCVEIRWNCRWFSLAKFYGALWANSCHRAWCAPGRRISTSQRSAWSLFHIWSNYAVAGQGTAVSPFSSFLNNETFRLNVTRNLALHLWRKLLLYLFGNCWGKRPFSFQFSLKVNEPKCVYYGSQIYIDPCRIVCYVMMPYNCHCMVRMVALQRHKDRCCIGPRLWSSADSGKHFMFQTLLRMGIRPYPFSIVLA